MTDRDRIEGKILLAVSAHPDDVEFTSGGSLARWAAEGWRVHLVVCTDGSRGSHDPLAQPRELARLRRQEQEAAGKSLGITQMVWGNYPDGELSKASDLAEWLAEIFRRVRPYRLLSWDPWKPYQLHPDHRAAGLAVLDAVLAAGNPHFFPSQLAGGCDRTAWRKCTFLALTSRMCGWTSRPPWRRSWLRLSITAAR